ncbi:protein kinase [Actinomadura sp. 3N508]|uniref:protein kinase domain-containing protein n=1 Tax=Actinomadura sp. 3N508 TaxID=3375153 RepID=UPI00379188CC
MAAEVLGDRYRLDELVGSGGMGQVWKAHDQTLDRTVAVKVIAGLNEAPEAAARLRREARTAAKLVSPHIAAVYDYGRDKAANRDYVVTEFVPGTDIGALVKRRGPQDPADVAAWGLQICDALTEAHEAGVYHRDLKPQNIMLMPRGTIKLVDFGIAAYAEAADYTRITASGMVIGTPAYMSPEQVEDKDIDQRSDLYSLGCTFFELLTGRVPFEGKAVTVLLDHVRTAPPRPSSVHPGVPENWDTIVLVLLSKNRSSRMVDAKSLRPVIENLVTFPATKAPPPVVAQSSATPPQRSVPSRPDGYHLGSVKWWNDEKGFGFITPDRPGRTCSPTTRES